METSFLGGTSTSYDWNIGGEFSGTMSAWFDDGRLASKDYFEMRQP